MHAGNGARHMHDLPSALQNGTLTRLRMPRFARGEVSSVLSTLISTHHSLGRKETDLIIRLFCISFASSASIMCRIASQRRRKAATTVHPIQTKRTTPAYPSSPRFSQSRSHSKHQTEGLAALGWLTLDPLLFCSLGEAGQAHLSQQPRH